MPKSSFWNAVDRLGASPAAVALWRMELGAEFDEALPFLHRVPGQADRIPDPDSPKLRPWMRAYPTDDEETYLAESEESPAHREAFTVPAGELCLLAPDWEAIRPALAAALGFTALTRVAAHSPAIRQLGFSQPEVSTTIPVFLYLPSGGFTDQLVLLKDLQTLPEGVLYVPTSRHLQPDVFAAARPRKIALESIVDRLAQLSPASSTLAVAAAATEMPEAKSKPPKTILAVQPGWVWEKLKIKLTVKGTLIATYGTARGTHQFRRTIGADGEVKYSVLFSMLFQTCHAGRWQHPPRSDGTYTAVQRNFARLGELLRALIRIDGDPFRRTGGGWEPRFQFEMDRELREAVDYMDRRTPDRSTRSPARRRSPEGDSNEPENE